MLGDLRCHYDRPVEVETVQAMTLGLDGKSSIFGPTGFCIPDHPIKGSLKFIRLVKVSNP